MASEGEQARETARYEYIPLEGDRIPIISNTPSTAVSEPINRTKDNIHSVSDPIDQIIDNMYSVTDTINKQPEDPIDGSDSVRSTFSDLHI